MRYEEIRVAGIAIPERHRATTPAKVKEIADSIEKIGLLQPIGVTDNYELIFGRHRLEAYEELGRETIPGMIFEGIDDLTAELAEIDENMIRHELKAIERGRQLARRKEIYEAMHPETAIPGRGKNQNPPSDNLSSGEPTFAEDTAAKTGKSRRTIERETYFGENLSTEAEEIVADTPIADNQRALTDIARKPPEEQPAAAQAEVAAATERKRKKTNDTTDALTPKAAARQKGLKAFGQLVRAMTDAGLYDKHKAALTVIKKDLMG